jgi:glycosyltransferase involved in cell wall biosynthesis
MKEHLIYLTCQTILFNKLYKRKNLIKIMGVKKSKKKQKEKDKDKKNLPFVSVCTPTFNRRPFIENMITCYKNQTYPRSKMEWIIVDDGTDPIKDIIEKHEGLNIKYFYVDKMNLGKKRNYMHYQSKGNIIVYMDDDDYYPPERVEHAVQMLMNNPNALCSGSSEIYVYFSDLNKMIQCGPYNKTHATAGTFAFRRKLLDITSYEDEAALAEERHFLKGYTIPFVQLDPLKTILVFSHSHNTFNKKQMLEFLGSKTVKESNKKVEDFIRKDYEEPVKRFFLDELEKSLEGYKEGLPIHKPEVLKQTEEIKSKREDIKEQRMEEYFNFDTGIVIETNGNNKSLTRKEIMDIIYNQKNIIKDLKENNIKTSSEKDTSETIKLEIKELNEKNKKLLFSLEYHKEYTERLERKIKELEKKLEDKD